MAPLIIDAGPIVALLDRNDAHHVWAARVVGAIAPPLLTCEAALTETLFLVRGWPAARQALFGMLRDGVLQVPFRLEVEAGRIEALMNRYADVPMSFADACLVRLCELSPRSALITLDRDFQIYRRNGSRRIDTVAPWAD